ncbi:phospholipase D family protein [uncultured Brevibacillus sp.]|uniref:phospholipase D family protein n=1 Tax=uncultured Brevibacillus sp. TaxID=169970 RepID=UPI002596161B|nr:phospholipase D family protein [uncultured Brevibacillus sp.]
MEIGTYYWHGHNLKNQLGALNNLKSVKIATAYISSYGVDLIENIVNKNNLKKSDVSIFLSPDFSSMKPSKILTDLDAISETYLVTKIPFHAKVILVEFNDLKTKVIFGSSNFTNGGIEKNIEFDLIRDITSQEEGQKLGMFFDFCMNNSTKVSHEVVNNYFSYETELVELLKVEKSIKKKLFAFSNKDDAFDEDDYEIGDFYFNFEDYETFFNRNEKRNDLEISTRRTLVRDKLLEIHNAIYKEVQEFNLSCHRSKKNITSLIHPTVYNKFSVGWLGVRYGKSPSELDILNAGAEKDEELGFQKHACLQFSITKRGFEVNLFHAVPHDAFDRNHVHDKFENSSFMKAIADEVQKLRGNNLIWYIYDNQKEYKFNLDTDDGFLNFYKANDKEGRESFLSYSVKPDDPRLKSLHSIANLVQEKVALLIPLYKAMSFRL